jgi:hypothetical protein
VTPFALLPAKDETLLLVRIMVTSPPPALSLPTWRAAPRILLSEVWAGDFAQRSDDLSQAHRMAFLAN